MSLVAFLAALVFAGTFVSPASGSTSSSNVSARSWLTESAAFYEARPELRIQRGSMWKHREKARVFLEARTVGSRWPCSSDAARGVEIRRQRQAQRSGDESGWFALGPSNLSGRIVDLKFHPTDPDIVYAASASGGQWISTNGGDTWTTTTDELPSLAVGAVCVLPNDPNVVLIGTGEGINWRYVVFGAGIWRSTDGGETWAETSLTYEVLDNHGFHVMEANPLTGTILAGANDGLWRSTDSGQTWSRALADGQYYDVKWKPGSATRVYASKGNGTGNGVLVSVDDGLTWGRIGSGQPPSSQISKTRIAVTAANPSILYAHYGDAQTYGTLGIYRSTNEGFTWTAQNTTTDISQSQGGYAVTIAVDPNDADRVIAGGIRLYRSTNAGVSFAETGAGNPLGEESSVHWDHHAIAWEPGSTSNLWVGNDGGIWRSTDDGETWHSRRDGLITLQYYDVCVDPDSPDFVMGGSQDNGLPWAEDPELPWFLSTLVADGFACFVESTDPNTIYSEAQFGNHVKSTNRGESWFATMNGLFGTPEPFAPLDLDSQTPGRLFTATSAGIFRSVDGQSSWQQVGPQSATWISISPVDGDVVWTVDAEAMSAPVRYTTNDTGNWFVASSYGFPVGNETKILAHPRDPATAFVSFAGYEGIAHVARTTNFGATWEDVSGDFPPVPANTMAIDADGANGEEWFVGSDVGIWRSTNNGQNWIPYGEGFPNVVVYDLEILSQPRKIIAATYGRGIWEASLTLTPSSTEESTSSPSVGADSQGHANLLLDPPYPNPAAETVHLRFATRSRGPWQIDVVDVRGRRVGVVDAGAVGDGVVKTAEWDPDGIASGIYYVTLRAGGETVSREIVLQPH